MLAWVIFFSRWKRQGRQGFCSSGWLLLSRKFFRKYAPGDLMATRAFSYRAYCFCCALLLKLNYFAFLILLTSCALKIDEYFMRFVIILCNLRAFFMENKKIDNLSLTVEWEKIFYPWVTMNSSIGDTEMIREKCFYLKSEKIECFNFII